MVANHRRYMPLYVAEYLADTTDLDATASGAYLFLIMHYWQHGSLPTDRKALRRIARLTPRQASKVIPHLAQFFQPGWRHKRIDRELQLADEAHEKRSIAAAVGNATRWNRVAIGSHSDRNAIPSYKERKNTTSTETVPRESKEGASRGSKEGNTGPIEPSDALRDAIERKGWKQ